MIRMRNHTERRAALLGLVLAIATAGCQQPAKNAGAVAPAQSGTPARTVHIAANLPISGDLSIYGTSVRDGANMAVEELERADPSGPHLQFDWQDNAGDPKNAVTIFQKQYLQPPDVYVSGLKPQTMAIRDQVIAKGTPHFVWIFDAFINRGATNHFRTYVSYKLEAPVYLEYVKARKARRVAILYVNLPHAEEEFQQLVIPRLAALGVQKTYAEAYDLGRKDYRDLANKVKGFQPDLIILNGFPVTLVGLVRALRPLDLIQDGNTIATYDMLDVAKLLGPAELEGIRVVAPTFVTRPDRPEVRQWRERFKARYGKDPWFTHVFAYDMAQLIRDAARRVSGSGSSPDWIQALRATDIPGVTGRLKLDKDGDLITPVEVGVYRGGKILPQG